MARHDCRTALVCGNLSSFNVDGLGALLKFIGDLHSGKLHREYHYGPDEPEEQEEQQQQQEDEGNICKT